MGRKSKKGGGEGGTGGGGGPPAKPVCYYCQRSFDTEDVLVSHQKLIHFKCQECGKKFGNAPAMGVHMRTMHSLELKLVPKALEGREDPTLHIVGTQGVPSAEELEERERKRVRLAGPNEIESLVSSAAVASSSGHGHPPAGLISGLVYANESQSPEEFRASLPRYKFDESALKEKLSEMDSNIEARLQSLLAARALKR